MLTVIKKNISFFTLYLIFLIAGGIVQLLYSQRTIFLFFNSHNNTPANYFFEYWTNLGDGIFAVLVVLLLLFFKNYKDSLLAAVVFVVSGLLAQFLKLVIFPDVVRPKIFFENIHEKIHFVEGVDINSYNSFPSGHSTSAFSVFCLLCLLFNGKHPGWLYFMLAILVAYSRMYLAQHFFVDIYFGSIIGTVTAVIFYVWFENMQNKDWHQKSLLGKKQIS